MSTTSIGAVPSAVVKRSERARAAGWTDQISVRVRDGRTSVLHRLVAPGQWRYVVSHVDGKAAGAYQLAFPNSYVSSCTLRDIDALIRADRPA